LEAALEEMAESAVGLFLAGSVVNF